MAEVHLDAKELALELTRLTIDNSARGGSQEWNEVSQNPTKWEEYVRAVYTKCLKTVQGDK